MRDYQSRHLTNYDKDFCFVMCIFTIISARSHDTCEITRIHLIFLRMKNFLAVYSVLERFSRFSSNLTLDDIFIQLSTRVKGNLRDSTIRSIYFFIISLGTFDQIFFCNDLRESPKLSRDGTRSEFIDVIFQVSEFPQVFLEKAYKDE